MMAVQSGSYFSDAREAMVEGVIRPANITEDWLVAAMSRIDRTDFVAPSHQNFAYSDSDLPAAPDGARDLMQPLALAKLVQAGAPQDGETCLIIGHASGYSAALLAGRVGAVIALESDPAMHDYASEQLAALEYANVICVSGPLEAGWNGDGPYDVIIIEGAVAEIPKKITDQLAERGRLVTIEIGSDGLHRGVRYQRFGSTVNSVHLFDLNAPPLAAFSGKASFVF